MADAARWNHVWVGTETGILKGVNLHRKQATNYTEVSSLSRDQEVCAMCWGDEQESEVLLGCRNGTVKVFNNEKGKYTEFRDCAGGEGPFRGLAVNNSALITCVESGLLKVWREAASENVEVNVGPGIYKMRQNPGKPHCVSTGGKENCLKVWDLENPQNPVFKAKNVSNDWLDLRVPVWVRDMQFLPGSEKIVTCTSYHQVRLYDPSCPKRRPVLETSFDEHPLTALSLTADASAVVVGNSHGNMAVIDLRQGRLLKTLKGLAGSIRSIQCHPTLPLVASCGLDRFLRVHSIEDKKLLYKVYLKSRLNCLLMTRREKWEEEEILLSAAAQDEVKDEDDEVWTSMETVTEVTNTEKAKLTPVANEKTAKARKRPKVQGTRKGEKTKRTL